MIQDTIKIKTQGKETLFYLHEQQQKLGSPILRKIL